MNNQVGRKGQQMSAQRRRYNMHGVDNKRQEERYARVFQIKLGLCIAIICSAVVLKTFMGGADNKIGKFVDEAVNGGIDYKQAVSVFGRAVAGDEDVLSVFKSINSQQKSDEKKSKEPKVPPKEEIKSAVDENFYSASLDITEKDTKVQPKQETVKQQPQKPAEKVKPVQKPQENYKPTVKAVDEPNEIETLSFQMTEAEMSDDTLPVPFTIPPPSYCSYEKISIAFKHVTPAYGIITSPFGYRDHPVGGNASFHTGMDIAAKQGTTIRSFADGKVIDAGKNKIYGNYVLIEHAGGIRSFYGHNSKVVVKDGQKVKMGQKVAEMGSTGLSTGPHVHFEIRKNNIRVNPKFYISLERV